jgi:tetraacyldisaccharide 4'-kinase
MVKVPSALAPALLVPGLAYEALVRARNGLYSAAIVPQRRLPVPVISIGNITMGGTGKTPLVIHIARVLADSGFAPAILTRGYGRTRSSECRTLAPGETAPNAAAALGDEPALIRRHLPSSWMGVSKNRFKAGAILSKQSARMVCLLDDGFQHRKLHRDLDIVILDGSRELGKDRIFPRGTLREPASALRRAHIVVINRSVNSSGPDPLSVEIRKLGVNAKIFYCRQRIQSLIPFRSWQSGTALSAAASSDQPVRTGLAPGMAARPPSAYLVAAIGNPERFLRDARHIGIDVRGTRFYPDHCRLSPKDWQRCLNEARRKGAESMITTEKDAVKIAAPPDFPLLVAVQTTEIADAGSFEHALKERIEARP